MTLPNACPKQGKESPEAKKLRLLSSARERERNRKKSPLKRTPLKSTRKPIPKKNDAKRARKAEGYRKGLTAYRKSETYKTVERRSGGRCERWCLVLKGENRLGQSRCPNSRADGLKMTHNHRTYSRFGGNELPGDIELLCPVHNAEYESTKRPWNKARKFSGSEA